MSRRKRGLRGEVSIRKVQSDDVEVRQIFFGEGLEDLTDALIDELVGRGWDRSRLLELRSRGFQYSRPRNSLISRSHFD